MRLLVDEALSPLVADLLRDLGHDAIHVRDIGLVSADDGQVLEAARADARVLVSADTDFGTIVVLGNLRQPSIVILRRREGRRAQDQASLVDAQVRQLEDELRQGSIVIVEDARVRVRRLPVRDDV